MQQQTQSAQGNVAARYDSLKATYDGQAQSQQQEGGQPFLDLILPRSWTDAIKRAFRSAFGDILGGILYAVLQAVVALVIIGGLCLLFPAAAPFIIIGALVVGAVLSIVGRWQAFKADNGRGPGFWEGAAIIGLGIADITGIPSIVEGIVGYRAFAMHNPDGTLRAKMNDFERAEAITGGIIALITLGLGIRVLKGKLGTPPAAVDPAVRPPARPVDPGAPPPVDPATPRPPTPPVDPNAPRPVDPNAPDPNAPRPVDPNAPDPNAPPPAPAYDPTIRTFRELQGDRNPAPRPGESAAQAAERSRLAQEEILRRAPEILEQLGDEPRRVDVRAEEPARRPQGAHTIENHGSDIPLRQTDAPPGGRSIEGRVTDTHPGWAERANSSFKWISDAVMNRVINDYLRANWERIRTNLALDGRHADAFDAGGLTGEGFVNSNMGGNGPPNPVYGRTSLVRIVVFLDPGPPAGFFVYTAFPNFLGTPAY